MSAYIFLSSSVYLFFRSCKLDIMRPADSFSNLFVRMQIMFTLRGKLALIAININESVIVGFYLMCCFTSIFL